MRNHNAINALGAALLGFVLLFFPGPGGILPASAQGRDLLPEGGRRPANFPSRFHGMGRIDSIEGNRIVIDDSQHTLAPFVRFATPRHRRASRSDFVRGRFVGYILDESGRIVSLWLIR